MKIVCTKCGSVYELSSTYVLNAATKTTAREMNLMEESVRKVSARET